MEDEIIKRSKYKPILSKVWWKSRFEDTHSSLAINPKKSKRPYSCDLLISEKCNLKCLKCHFWKSDVDDAVSIKTIKQTIDSLSKLGERPFEINFGGGEPLLVNGIIDIIRYAAKKGLQPALSTNATLIDKVMAKKLSKAGLNRLSISLDSLDASVHDKMTGVRGSYNKLMLGLDNLAAYWKYGDLNIHTVLSEINKNSVVDLVKWVDQNGIIKGINIQAISQPFRSHPIDNWYESEEYKFLWPKNIANLEEILKQLIELKKNGAKIINPLHQFRVYALYYAYPERFARKFRCNAGDHTININSMSLMHLCCFMKPLGTLKQSSIEELWQSPQAEATRYAMNNCRKSCNNILNCFFEEEDIKAGFQEDISVKASEANPICDDRQEATTFFEKITSEIEFCNFNLTPECNLPCKMCHTWKANKIRGLNNYYESGLLLAEWRYLMDEVASFAKRDMRIFFGGGEPLLRRGIFNLLEYANEKGFFSMLGTSCYPLNATKVRKLAQSGLNFLNVSLDSIDPKIHDYLRGRKGILRKIISSATALKKINPNLDIGASTVISKVNLDGIIDLLKFIEQDERFSNIYFQTIVQPYDTVACNYWYRLKEYKFLWPETSKINDVLDEIIRRKINGSDKIGNSIEQLKVYKYYYNNPEEFHLVKKCLKNNNSISVNWMGYVSFCDYLGPIGNVRDFTLKQLLSSRLATIRSNEMKNCELKCNFIENVKID